MKKKYLVYCVIGGLMLTAPAYAATGVAKMAGTATDSLLSGEITFTENADGIEVEAKIVNAPPGKHGFHIHEVGDCSDEGKAAGGHFNPGAVKHGFLPKDGHAMAHAGDLGNIDIGADGQGSFKEFLPGVYLTKEPNVSGRAVIVHEKEDDFGQPTGNAGGRIGCGIISSNDIQADGTNNPAAEAK